MSRIPVSLFLVVLLLSACSGPRTPARKAEEAPAPKIEVPVGKALVREVSASIGANGSFIAEEASDIAPAAGGRVAATPVDVGDFVKQGEVICRLEQREAELRLEQARAALEQAKFVMRQAQSRVGHSGSAAFDPESVPEVASSKAAYESALSSARMAGADARRYEHLGESGDVSRSSYEKYRTQQETAEAAAQSARRQYEGQLNAARQSFGAIEAAGAALAAAESQVAQARKNLEDTAIRAPFAGYITDRPAAVGQWLGTGNKVATLLRIARVKLRLEIPEQQAALVRKGMGVTARVAAYPERDFTGRVSAVVPSVDAVSRVFLAEALFDNPRAELRPGMFASARVMLPGSERAVFVPAPAVFYDNTTDANHIYSVVDGVARLRVVLRGDSDGDQVRILSGLDGGEAVVLSNQTDLYDGAPVSTRP